MVVQVPVDSKVVCGGQLSFGGLRHEVPTFAVAPMMRRLTVRRLPRRRMTYSATARLMTQAAPRLRSCVSTLGPKTAGRCPG